MLCRNRIDKLVNNEYESFSQTATFQSIDNFLRTVREMEKTILIPSRLIDLTLGDSTEKINLDTKNGSIIKKTVANMDLYKLYNIISRTKVELLWSQDCNNYKEIDNNMIKFVYGSRCNSYIDLENHAVKSSSNLMELENNVTFKNDNNNSPELDNRTNSIFKDFDNSFQETENDSAIKINVYEEMDTNFVLRADRNISMNSISNLSDSESDFLISEIDSGIENENGVSLAARNFKKHLRALHNNIKKLTLVAEYLTLRYQNHIGCNC
ncbi:uncharacterized protein LOC108632695 [Ceratina calcarata]|uniref:Uncharacterized protein LOC108632695 n=1 Tax=Ceratina calcarata TaxID=156304 RepID=A0AAJ7JGW4_9HYME|nr:uncharacterized protein LOC108632695 [Ceratina calcarata]